MEIRCIVQQIGQTWPTETGRKLYGGKHRQIHEHGVPASRFCCEICLGLTETCCCCLCPACLRHGYANGHGHWCPPSLQSPSSAELHPYHFVGINLKYFLQLSLPRISPFKAVALLQGGWGMAGVGLCHFGHLPRADGECMEEWSLFTCPSALDWDSFEHTYTITECNCIYNHEWISSVLLIISRGVCWLNAP